MQTSQELPSIDAPEPSPAPKSNAMLILVATLCAVFAMPFSDDRNVEFPHRWWKLHGQYLDGVAMVVAKYKDVHGHYPDNNQGIHDLDTFDVRFDASLLPRESNSALPARDPANFFNRQIDTFFWHRISEEIRRYRVDPGLVPQNGISLNYGPFLVTGGDDLSSLDDERRVQVAISQNDCFYLLGPNCVYDPSITPYVYENRNGLDAKLFANSIANSDPGRKFSREVAQGVYVYSYNARHYYETYWSRLLVRRGRIYGFGGLAMGLFVVAAFRARRYRLGLMPFLFPVVGAILTFGASSGVWMTCYVPSSMPWRNPKDLDAQKRLLEQFRDSGVITPETYGKAMKGYETDAVFVPSKEPGKYRE